MRRFTRFRSLLLLAVGALTLQVTLIGCFTATAQPAPSTIGGSLATTSGITATPKSDGAVVTWTAASGAAAYKVYRRTGTSAAVVVNTVPVTGTRLFDAGLTAGTSYTYSVAAVSSSGAESPLPGSVTVRAADPLASYAGAIARECPAATKRVSTAEQLRTALAGARAGEVIWLQPGVYRGKFKLERSGTTTSPIWLCGTEDSVLETGSISDGSALVLDKASNVGLSGFAVRNSLQGVMVKFSSNVTIARLTVTDIGYEGIHVYALSSNAVIRDNTIRNTGVVDVAYGEGIYIGTSNRRWDVVTSGQPDTTRRVVVLRNTIVNAGAEPIEAKEGTSDGVIEGNVITGHQTASRAIGWVLVTGNSWLIRDNTGSDAVTNAYALMKNGTQWGLDNSVVDNSGEAGSAAGWGVLVHHPGSPVPAGTVVGCDNRVSGTASGVTHVPCQN
ncbi:right-handed parallel beta-helix repeat-containing protein [Naasia sp. SYSU D00948]|uniref:right-handed parallel beta-helix repeat-containing protein n=1 Tax=Naasia sp. SYSU D00948 TaxID=2817379 RepID=UPI001B309003|nr:right-handed parallel beta-helix repeat-containing protein [Naasia sp. SYSU D00948]